MVGKTVSIAYLSYSPVWILGFLVRRIPGNRQLIQEDGDGLEGKAERASGKELSWGHTKNVSAIFFHAKMYLVISFEKN